MTDDQVVVIQKIENQTQMQYCGVEYLENGHSEYAAYEIDRDNEGLCFHGSYTEWHEMPDWIAKLNGCCLHEVAEELFLRGQLSKHEYELVKPLTN